MAGFPGAIEAPAGTAAIFGQVNFRSPNQPGTG